MERVGMIGLGRMGSAMARHLLDAGYPLAVYDIVPAAVDAVAAAGGDPCASAREVAFKADVVLVAVGFATEVEAVVHGLDGLWAGARPGTLVVVTSTVEPEFMHHLACEAVPLDVEVMDAGLVHGERGAVEGRLLIVAGGRAAAVQRADPVLRTFSQNILHVGPLGSGQATKALNSYLRWACTCVDSEVLGLAQAFGLEAGTVRQALLMGSGANRPLAQWLDDPMPWAEKDMTILLSMADRAEVSLPLAGVVRETVKGIKLARGLPTPKPTC